jgi:hypothetical protein
LNHKFESEASLCDAFIGWAQKQGWTIYPESCGFDILMVNKDGHQFGIEAKLKLNSKVIDQILDSGWEWRGKTGPHHRGILVPDVSNWTGIVRLLGIAGIEVFRLSWAYESLTTGQVFEFTDSRISGTEYFDHNPSKLLELPEFVPDVRAGVPAPVQLTKWKIGALRLMARLELQGYITRLDCREFGIDHRRFCASDGWLTSIGEGKWVAGSIPRFDQQHPEIYKQVLAELQSKPKAGLFA